MAKSAKFKSRPAPKLAAVNSRPPAKRLAFNFSFVTATRKYGTSEKYFTQKVRAALVQKMVKLSAADFVVILGLPRESGLENLADDQVRFAIAAEFMRCLDGMWVFRLNRLGRVIGKIDGATFYVLGIDTTFDAYNHG